MHKLLVYFLENYVYHWKEILFLSFKGGFCRTVKGALSPLEGGL